MKIHEYIAKDIFNEGGIPVPHSRIALSPEEARKVAVEIG